ncbi:MAG: ATP-binding cassette domain-containing protein [Nitrospiraceae bacterium]|nr:ATP-binding cassette domain-containing protein [Nitrospiraceae bacterium]
MPLVIRGVVAAFENERMTPRLLWLYLVGLIAISIATGFSRYFERKLIISASRKAEYDLRNDFFRHIQSLSQDFFHRVQTGDLMARATNDLNFVRMFIGPGIMGTIDMMRLPLTLGVMVYLSGRLTLLSLLPLPLVSILVYGIVMFMHRQSQKIQAQYSVVTSRVQENLAGARVVKAYGVADREVEAFEAESMKYMRENIKLASVMSFAMPLIGMVVALMILLVLWRGGLMVIDGSLELEDLTGFIVCMLLLVWPLAEFGWIMTLYQRGAVGMNRINEVFAEIPTVRDGERTRREASVSEGHIRFQNVCFSYADQATLQQVDFEVLPGQTVAIVGLTGSGKSTVVSMLTREYDVTSGAVLVDGQDVREIPVQSLRGAMGYVLQDTFLFSDSIRANVTFGRPHATGEEIARACDTAQFTETVEGLPEGLDTLLGERGVNLSGGQKQRLAIARAVVCDPKILILDDALSSVDTHTEEMILQRLKEVMANRTSIIISHRISTILHADLILVLEGGRVVEQGTHETLLELGGLYAELHERQLLEEELEGA